MEMQNNSLEESSQPVAVLVQNASKSYSDGVPIIRNFNMQVLQGSIYGLLGPSGCGKTTILSCIVGLRKLNSGSITVFGKEPGSGIPGQTLGFMPQDIALYEIFTVGETFKYFGHIYGMSSQQVRSRMQFLAKFLDLPPLNSYVANLSGGQRRRTSLAISMFNQPPILILDEPTVGCDPLLRESIWAHLTEMVKEQQTTILISTHYIQEAQQNSHRVGIMRNGHLLVEKCPRELLEEHNTDNLESLFLKLCHQDEALYHDQNSIESHEISQQQEGDLQAVAVQVQKSSPQNHPANLKLIAYKNNTNEPINNKRKLLNHLEKVYAIVMKNMLTLTRTIWFVFVLILIPVFQVMVASVIFNSIPKNVPLGLVNNEMDLLKDGDGFAYCKNANYSKSGCFQNKISCDFINIFPDEDVTWRMYNSELEALESVQRGKTFGYISFPVNYTNNMFERAIRGRFLDDTETIDGSTIKIRLDKTDTVKADFLAEKLVTNFQKFVIDLADDCNETSTAVQLPLKYNPIYGSLSSGYVEFLLPGCLMSIIFLLPTASSLSLVKDRKEGTLQRSVVAGVRYPHFITAFVITEGFLILLQVALCFGYIVFIMGYDIKGSLVTFFMCCFMNGLTGLAFGFFVGTVCDHELEAILSVLGFYMAIFIVSGTTWPVEALNPIPKLICKFLPITLPTISVRSILNRGWSYHHPQVWPGFALSAAWIISLSIASVFIQRFKNKNN